MPAELGRIDLGDVTPHNIKLLRKVNTVVFPVSYHDKFYKVIKQHLRFHGQCSLNAYPGCA